MGILFYGFDGFGWFRCSCGIAVSANGPSDTYPFIIKVEFHGSWENEFGHLGFRVFGFRKKKLSVLIATFTVFRFA